MDSLIDLADYDNDGLINYAEFARLITAEDVVNMKDTLSGGVDERNFKIVGPSFKPAVAIAELRYVQQEVCCRLLIKYMRITDPFKRMDHKRTGAFSSARPAPSPHPSAPSEMPQSRFYWFRHRASRWISRTGLRSRATQPREEGTALRCGSHGRGHTRRLAAGWLGKEAFRIEPCGCRIVLPHTSVEVAQPNTGLVRRYARSLRREAVPV
jgi:hypothetical protein